MVIVIIIFFVDVVVVVVVLVLGVAFGSTQGSNTERKRSEQVRRLWAGEGVLFGFGLNCFSLCFCVCVGLEWVRRRGGCPTQKDT